MSVPSIGSYRLERRLGSGTFATVWLGWDPDLERHVAIKILADNWSMDEDVRNRFLQEARILWRLDHPRIVRVFLTGTLEDGRPYFVMEFADGGSLHDRIQRRKAQGQSFSIHDAIELSCDIADGLIVAHSRGIIHRDLKPSNILFTRTRSVGTDDSTESERLMLADFGIARQLERATHMTITAGTPYYMAPEQANPTPGQGPNQQSDVYAAATVLYELLTGDVPYPYESISQVIKAQERGDRKPVRSLRPDVPEGLARVIDTGLESGLEHRYSSAKEWKDALLPFAVEFDGGMTEIKQDRPTLNPDQLPNPRAKTDDPNENKPVARPRRQRVPVARYGVGAGIVLLLALFIWKVYLNSNSPTPDPTPTSSSVVIVTTATSTIPASVQTPVPTVAGSTVNSGESTATTNGGDVTDDPYTRLQSAFGFMSTSCTHEPLEPETDAIATCAGPTAGVTYREYTNGFAGLAMLQSLQTEYQAEASGWAYATDPTHKIQGKMLQFIDNNQHAEIFWTLDSKNMSGTAIANDNDQATLFNWWKSAAAQPPKS